MEVEDGMDWGLGKGKGKGGGGGGGGEEVGNEMKKLINTF